MRGLALAAAAGGALAQQRGQQTEEAHPMLNVQQCTKSGGCTSMNKPVVLDSNWRWTNQVGGYLNCFTGNEWNQSVCGSGVSGAECAGKCALEGVDAEQYQSTYGVRAEGAALNLLFVTKAADGNATNVGSRTYLMEDEEHYMMFKLKNREFTFDVDVSQLGCGLNGALYFVEMDADGGMGKYSTNKAGAKLGTGYCDAQCPHDMKWINGEANIAGYKPSGGSGGSGQYGSCCTEMDIWEANKMATAYTPHACDVQGQTRCGPDTGTDCGSSEHGSDRFDGVCDANGCDMQTYRMGLKSFYGPGLTVDTNKPMTVVTQFVTSDGTDNGDVVEIRRLYVQDGKQIPTPMVTVGSAGQFDSVTDAYCQAEVDTFKDGTTFLQRGGMKAMSDSLGRGMVLVMSLWDDSAVNMLWLDSTYPPGGGPGAERGPCADTTGKPEKVEQEQADASVTYYNIKWGEIGSTYSGASPPAPPFPVGPPPAPGPSGGLPAKCGGSSVADGQNCQTDALGPDCCPVGASGAQQGCFVKNQYWAGCKDSCDPSWVDPYDGATWTCTCLSASCPGTGPPPAAPTPPPAPGGNCPGGSLTACMGLCPASPAAAYKACVNDCVSRC